MAERVYLAIDLKSFYASVECIEQGLDPMTTNLVVADKSRTEKTICLAVSPSLKAYGIPGRPRLFEVVQKVREVNAASRGGRRGKCCTGSSWEGRESWRNSPSLAVDYLVAVPRMALYMKYSSRIYEIYLKYIAPEDIHVYSIDEVFMDLTGYLNTYQDVCAAAGDENHSGCSEDGWHHRHCRNRNESVSLQSGHGYWRQAYSSG